MISAVLIVKNEELVLEECLKSLKHYPIITEIVIVDTGSQDKTIKIAKKYTNKVYNYKWNDDFARARNFAKSKATNNWILSIDADEILETFIDEEIKDNTDGLYVTLTNNTETTTNACRLFKKELEWQGKIHEYIQPTKPLNSDILIRFGRSPSHDLDPLRNIRILAKEYNENPNNPRTLYYLGRELFSIGKYNESIDAIQQYTSQEINFYNPELIDAYFLQALNYFMIDKKAESKILLGNIIIRNPNFKNVYSLLQKIDTDKYLLDKWKQLEDLATNEGVLLNINLNNLLGDEKKPVQKIK